MSANAEYRAPNEASPECKDSLRVDGKHGWLSDGHDPCIYCIYCGELRDVRTGEVIG